MTTTNSALVLSDPNGNSVLVDTPNPITFDFSVSDSECEYTGGVNVSDNSDDEYYKGSGDEVNSESDSDYSLAELDKNLQALQDEAKAELAQLEVPTAFERILKSVPDAVWKKAERDRKWGYNGLSKRTRERQAQHARAAAKTRETAKNS